jgi:hypothetical protein
MEPQVSLTSPKKTELAKLILRQLGHAEILSVPAAFRTTFTSGLTLSGLNHEKVYQ